ncbi:MAG: fasciclin domain-containing protein [Alphaproteobacteria bacterium]|nr:fasciclin domain-containing protein [Alphaproteobacteria bacterium]MBU2143074.1 fasciclin domain-containing protein [Alphaproteobacteria bacterium]MBU2197459.1 fasciclin domain-containing protein [Alphaproteobacteria bacterium]
MMKTLLLTTIAASALFLAACSDKTETVTEVPATTPVETAEVTPTETTATPVEPMELPTLVDVLGSSPDFSTLVAAIGAADLTETLSGPASYTIFAPTNEAFAAMDPALLEDLMKPENKDKLVTVLSYHVLPGKISSSELAGKSEAMASLNNKDMLIDGTGDNLMVNTSTVTMGDIEASNGVIHVIDTVLVPRFEE